MKLRTRLIVLILLTSLLTLGIVSVLNYETSMKPLKQFSDDTFKLKNEILANDINSWLTGQQQSVLELSWNMQHNNNFDNDYLHNYLAMMNQRKPEQDHFMAFSDNAYADAIGWVPGADWVATERPWFKGAIENEGVNFSDPYYSNALKAMVVTMSKSFETTDGRTGVVAGDVLLNFLVQFMDAENQKLQDGSYYFLADSKGNILTHQEEAYKPTEDTMKNLSELFDGKLKSLVEKGQENTADRVVSDSDGQNKILYVNDIPVSNWKLVAVVPEKNVTGYFQKTMQMTLIATLILIILSSIMAFYTAGMISRPINYLSGVINNMSLYNFTMTEEDKDSLNKLSLRNDEISFISRSITEMRNNLIDLINNIATSSGFVAKASDNLSNISKQSSLASEEVA